MSIILSLSNASVQTEELAHCVRAEFRFTRPKTLNVGKYILPLAATQSFQVKLSTVVREKGRQRPGGSLGCAAEFSERVSRGCGGPASACTLLTHIKAFSIFSCRLEMCSSGSSVLKGVEVHI